MRSSLRRSIRWTLSRRGPCCCTGTCSLFLRVIQALLWPNRLSYRASFRGSRRRLVCAFPRIFRSSQSSVPRVLSIYNKRNCLYLTGAVSISPNTRRIAENHIILCCVRLALAIRTPSTHTRYTIPIGAGKTGVVPPTHMC